MSWHGSSILIKEVHHQNLQTGKLVLGLLKKWNLPAEQTRNFEGFAWPVAAPVALMVAINPKSSTLLGP